MELLTPEDQSNLHYWVSVLLAHAFIGFMVAGGTSGISKVFLGKPYIVVVSLTVSLGYLILWEVMLQGLGAGVRDAFIDSFAFFAGASAWVFAATRNYLALGLVAALIGGIIAARMEDDKDKRD
jgi:hypothetical protein